MTSAKNSLILRAIPLMLIVIVLCPFAYGKIIYVDDNAIGANDGSSWENAYIYLDNVLEYIADPGDEIRVAGGIYKPIGQVSTFRLPSGISLIGGYAGVGEPDPNARDIQLYETILSGDLEGNDGEITDPCALLDDPNRADNCYNVLVIDPGWALLDDYEIRLDGFTIKGGNANPTVSNNFSGHFKGGGLYCGSVNLTITDCTFEDNSAFAGGAIYNRESNLILIRCKFNRNTAATGGAIYNLRYSEIVKTVLRECTFADNTSVQRESPSVPGWSGYNPGRGGAIYSNLYLDLTRCKFTRNSAAVSGGGIYCDSEWSIKIDDCEFLANSAGSSGGGLYSHSYASSYINGTLFTENNAGVLGGAIYHDGNYIHAKNCLLVANSSMWRGGAISNDGRILFENCVFAQNRAIDSDGALNFSLFFSDTRLVNCIFQDNTSNNGSQIGMHLWGYLSMSYCNIVNSETAILNTEGWDYIGQGNIDADPLFASPGYWDPNGTLDDPNDDFWIDGDYHLKSSAGRWDPNSQNWVFDDVNSPCIDTGDPNGPVAFEPYPNGMFINMGAYGGTAKASKSPSGLNAKYGGGIGEPNDPYLIYTAGQLNNIANHPNDWDKHFKLMADIDLSGYLYNHAPIAWDTNDTETGFQGTSFTGVFYGNDHTISNLTIKGGSYLGLFGMLGRASRISDLGIIDVNVIGAFGVGGLVGADTESIHAGGVNLTECYSTGTVSGDSAIGGLAGVASGMVNCYSIAEVNGNFWVGGLIGTLPFNGNLTDCSSSAKVSGDSVVGGLVGNVLGGTNLSMMNCCSTVDVSGDSRVGGLVGEVMNGYLVDCYSSGVVVGKVMVGGLVGSLQGYEFITHGSSIWYGSVIDCYCSATVSGDSVAGGLVGSNDGGRVANCYSTGMVGGNVNIGGLVGFNENGNITASFWDIETSGQVTSNGGIGKTTSEMQTESTFTDVGWDFIGETDNGTDDIWWIDEGNDYPRLWWELVQNEQ